MKPFWKAALCLLLTTMSPVRADQPADAERFSLRWVYAHPGFDLRTEEGTQQWLDLITRAKRAGYNGVCIKTGPLEQLGARQPDAYYSNTERIRAHAASLNVELIPSVMRMNGYSNGILSNNPHLAAGIPVKDCEFVVVDGNATLADSGNLIAGGDFESFAILNRPEGWDWIDLPGKSAFEDNETRHSGNKSVRFDGFESASEHGNCRIFKKLQLEPWRQYHLRFWLKTQAVKSPERIQVQVFGDVDQNVRRNLQRRSIDARSTQDWTSNDVVFNTLQNTEVWLYIGGWGAGGGKIWLDDVTLHQVAGINLLRRDGCPIRVTSEDGSQEFIEGEDFQRWEYPNMGRVRWPGQYELVHPQPPIVLTENSRIRNGQMLKVSYFHALMHMNEGICICLSQDEVFDLLEEHLKTVKQLYQPKTYLMAQDEVRLAGWCECCNPPGITTGQVLARAAHRCADIIHRVDPGAEIVTWSDMFDPHHNAIDNYWLTRDTIRGSWEGLERDVWIGNWNHGRAKESLAFFADRGHRQLLATYYDRRNWHNFVRRGLEAAEGVPHVDGIIYTTWSNDYQHLEEFMQLVSLPATLEK
ncbi:MAG: hypothetical protein KDA75_00315 [Planctomycetaceae bacterium]|nr:hypothetical protein [Planctomycetaceae bacterium]